jgi:hypothetical protein
MGARGHAANDLRLGLKRCGLKRKDFRLISVFRFGLLFEHDLSRKAVSTFRDHALELNEELRPASS